MLGKPGDMLKAVLTAGRCCPCPCQPDMEFGGIWGGGFEPYRPGAETKPWLYGGSVYQDIGFAVRGKLWQVLSHKSWPAEMMEEQNPRGSKLLTLCEVVRRVMR